MDILDVLLKQIENRYKSKSIIRGHICDIKDEMIRAGFTENDLHNMSDDDIFKLINKITSAMKPQNEVASSPNLLMEILHEQWLYLMLNTNIDTGLAYRYEHMFYNCDEYYHDILNYLKKTPFKYTFEYNLSTSLIKTINNIDSYCESLKIATKTVYKHIERGLIEQAPGMQIFMMYHNDVIGNEDAWSLKVMEWKLSRRSYKLHIIERMKKADIIRYFATVPEFKYKFNLEIYEMSNLTHKLNAHLKEARHLIASAAQGSFPH